MVGIRQRGETDWLIVGVWIGALVVGLLFWAGVGWGISLAFGSDAPRCTYSGVEMHQHWGVSSAACELP